MSTISQSIPNLLLGISQQPDNRKRPGQVKDAQNVFPDFALGMLKRPGGKFITKLDGAQTRGKWFPILRDGTEKYICQYDTTDSLFRVWNLSDGIRRVVDMGSDTGQPVACNIPSLFTAFTNVGTAKHTLADAETAVQVAASDLSKKTLGQRPTLNTLFATDFRKFSNPRSEDYAERLKEEIRSGVFEIEGNARQATAEVTVSNEITAAGVSDGGAGYETAPTVAISGSGSNATAEAVLDDKGDLKRIDITNAGDNYFDIPTVTFTGGLSNYHGTAVVNWFTQEVTKVLVEDGDFIDLTDSSETWQVGPNVGVHASGYGGPDPSLQGQKLFRKKVDDGNGNLVDTENDVRWYNTGRDQMVFSDGSQLSSDPQGIYLNKRDLTGKSKIRIMAATGNRNQTTAEGPSASNGNIHLNNDGTKHYSVGHFNSGTYNKYKDGPYGNSVYPTLDIYIAKAGVTPVDHQGNTPVGWIQPSLDVNGPPNTSFIADHPGNTSTYRGDWRHIGQVIGDNPDKTIDKPYYLSEYEFDIPADLRGPDCWIVVGTRTQNPSIGYADESRKFTVTTMTLLNETPTTTNIADSGVIFTENTALGARIAEQFPYYQTDNHYYSGDWYTLDFYPTSPSSFVGTLTTPNRITYFDDGITTAVADVVLGKAVSDINITNAGSGYNNALATTIALSGGSFTQAATPTITVTPTFTASITDAGKGYKSATATMTGGGGSGAVPTVTTTNGLVTGISFTGGDSNYLSNPTIALSAPNTDNPKYAEVIYKKNGDILTGALTHVEVKKSGQGLTAVSATNVATTTNGNGTGVTLDLTVSNGQVHAVSINTNGTGYHTDEELYPTGYPGVIIRTYGMAKGTERTSEHPVIASDGYKVYELDESIAPANTPAELTAATTAYNNAVTARDTAETALGTAGAAAGAQGAACAITNLPNNTLEITGLGHQLTNGNYTAEATSTSGSGTGMTVDVTVTNNVVSRVNINNGGTGYALGDYVFLTSNNFPDAVEITKPGDSNLVGSGGTNIGVTTVTGSGSGMTVDVTIVNGEITVCTINNPGTGYAEGDTMSVNTYANTLITFRPVELQFGQPPYLKGATADDIELLTLNDYTFVLNKKREVKMKALKTPIQDPYRACVVVNSVTQSGTSPGIYYYIKLTKVGATATTSVYFPTGTSGNATTLTIANGLANNINTLTSNQYKASHSGGVVIITADFPFSMETQGGTTQSSYWGFTDSIANTSLLPLHCKDGYVVRVTNSDDIDIDDMYVKFRTNGDLLYGTGYWEECAAEDIEYKIDPLTMPHALVRQEDGKFTYQPVDWNDRIIGDNVTNPVPSFVNNTISSIFFYRNRMGFLSGQNVILSRAGDLFNFWYTTAQTSVNDDPIDISAAGKRPVFLNYVQPSAVGLVLYATNEQFLLSTDSDILAPTSAKVNAMSEYETDANVESVSLGTSQAFVTKTPLYTRLFELAEISSEQQPLMADISNVVPELIPQSIDSMVASPALSVVSLGATGSSDIYQYRFLSQSRDERLVNCWYRWSLTGTLLTQFFDSSTYFTAVANGSDVYVQSYDMTQSSEEGFLTLPTGEKTDVCLDLFDINPVHSYDSATDKTRIELPYDAVVGKELNVVVLGGFIGDANVLSSQSVGAVLKPTIQGTAGNQYVEINGDFQGRDLIIGFNYDMKLTLPTIYRYKEVGGQVVNDDVSSLIMHRIKVKTGLSGPVDYKVSITGLDDWDNTVSVTQPNQYQLNNVNMQASSTHVVPVFQRNENLAVQIIGNTPFPVSLLGLDWEGKLNERFYRRG